jgi:hypothetical protein
MVSPLAIMCSLDSGLTQNNSQDARIAYSDGACAPLVSRFSVRECLVCYNSITTRGGTIGPMALDDTTPPPPQKKISFLENPISAKNKTGHKMRVAIAASFDRLKTHGQCGIFQLFG